MCVANSISIYIVSNNELRIDENIDIYFAESSNHCISFVCNNPFINHISSTANNFHSNPSFEIYGYIIYTARKYETLSGGK